MNYTLGNYILDVILILASIWMFMSVRGIGGIMGKTLSLVIAGAIILGVAHLLADAGSGLLHLEAPLNNFIHRLIVLVGFVLVALGFRQAQQLTR